MKVPCYNCPNRHPQCHSQCESYRSYKNGLEKIAQTKANFAICDGYVMSAIMANDKYKRLHA